MNDVDSDPEWYKDAIFYELRVPSFYDGNGDGLGDFPGLIEKLDYLQDLGVTALWLLPFFPSPMRDDGYDISNYMDVHPSLGTLADFRHFLREAHRRGLRVVGELVLNHTSDAHVWFKRARRAPSGSSARDFYVWSDSTDRYGEARIIFKDFERSNWTWDPVAGAYYWHRFFSHQPDLNFDNPAVRRALLRVVDFWFGMGVDGLRLDAVPYLYEREGTNCENLPETFAFLEELRRHVDRKFKDKLLLAEANQWPEDAVRYLEGGNKCHMAFHFPIMPRMFVALRMEDRFPITEILAQTPPLPASCQWALFLRNHDELTLEMVTDEERDYMYRAYGKDPSTRLNLGIRRRLAPLLENNRRRIELMNGLLLSLPGSPILYYGDEIGMGDNIHLGDRNGVRTPMQWNPDRNAGFSGVNPQKLYLPVIIDPEYNYESVNVETEQQNPSSLLWWTKRLIALRKRYRAFGRGTCEFLEPDNPKVLAFVRQFGEERLLVVANLSRFTQFVELDLAKFRGLVPVDVFGRAPFPPIRDAPYALTPGPHAILWFTLEAPQAQRTVVERRRVIPEIRNVPSGPGWATPQVRSELEAILPDFLRSSRWFGGKSKTVKATRIADMVSVLAGETSATLLVVEVTYGEDDSEMYCCPVALVEGTEAEALLERAPQLVLAKLWPEGNHAERERLLVDAFRVPDFSIALFEMLHRGRRLRSASTEIRSFSADWFRRATERRAQRLEPRVFGGEQSNTSVVFGDRFILKLYRRLVSGRNADLEVGRFLTDQGFSGTPRVAGWLEYRHGLDEPSALAIVHEYVPGTRDAWSYVCEELKRYFERVLAIASDPGDLPARCLLLERLAEEPSPAVATALGTFPASIELLGRRTAELHLALASDSENEDFSPEPYGSLYQRSVYQSLRDTVRRVMRKVRRALPGLPHAVQNAASELLAQEPEILSHIEEFRQRKVEAVRIRHHGDYHLGQVLFTGKDFVIIDFEGEPARSPTERLIKRSPLRDVSGMLRSFNYAAVSMLLEELDTGTLSTTDAARLELWSRVWCLNVSRCFVRAYLATAKNAPFVPQDTAELRLLLNIFNLDKALYEVGYELDHRPAWLGVSLRGIRNVLADWRGHA
jgi:maltose alpha-D-glucosyltransferase / alpha-amylase